MPNHCSPLHFNKRLRQIGESTIDVASTVFITSNDKAAYVADNVVVNFVVVVIPKINESLFEKPTYLPEKKPLKILEKTNPDVVQVQNIYPLISVSIFKIVLYRL